MLTYTISVLFAPCSGIRSFLAKYLSNHSNHSTCPDTRPDTINTRPRRRPSVQLEMDRPGIEARLAPSVRARAAVAASLANNTRP